MAILYPRKQTVILFIISLAAVAGTAYLANGSHETARSASKVSVSGTDSGKNSAETYNENIDSTAFGDWKKQFEDSRDQSAASTSESQKNLTVTDKFSRDFFARYMELKQANLLNNEEVMKKSTDALISSNIDYAPQKVYTEADIRITGSSDPATLAAYSRSIATIMESYNLTKNESDIVNEYIEKSDPKVLEGMNPVISAYKRIIAELIAVPAPQKLAKDHVKLINSFELFRFSAEALQAAETDTLRSLSGITAHVSGATFMIEALTGIHDTLETLGTAFNFRQDVLNVLLG